MTNSVTDLTYDQTVQFIKTNTGHGDLGEICKRGGFSRGTLDNALRQKDFTDLSEGEREALKAAVVFATGRRKEKEKEAESFRAELKEIITS